MTGEIFYWILNMSILASAMGLIVLLIRKVRVIPRRISVWLWLIPFLRLCIPFGLSSSFSLMTLISKFTTRTFTVYEPSDELSFSFTNTIMVADSYEPFTYKSNIFEKIFSVAEYIWIIVALAVLIALAIIYVTTKKEIKDAALLKGNVYLSSSVTGPACYGIVKPRIVLPLSYEKRSDIDYVIRHEKTHIRRLDNLWRVIGFIAASVHWFNPLSWIFLKCFLEDIELACDEMAVSSYGTEERKEYARALLSCSQSRSLMVSAFGGAKVRTRIENVLSYKKMTLFSASGFTLLTAVIIYFLITNAG